MYRKFTITLACVCCIWTLSACSNDGARFRSACGIIQDGELRNSLKEDQAEEVTLTGFFEGNILTLRDVDDNDLTSAVLHGIAPAYDEQQLIAVSSFVAGLIGERGYFFPASSNCTIDSGIIDSLTPGQFFLDDGTNLGEELLLMGLASVDNSNRCGSGQLEGCLSGLVLEGNADGTILISE